MSESSDAYDGRCPDCGHIFMLAELKRMACGDGWERKLRVIMPNSKEGVVSFSDHNPKTMTPIGVSAKRESAASSV